MQGPFAEGNEGNDIFVRITVKARATRNGSSRSELFIPYDGIQDKRSFSPNGTTTKDYQAKSRLKSWDSICQSQEIQSRLFECFQDRFVIVRSVAGIDELVMKS
jgi:hypothetical protein